MIHVSARHATIAVPHSADLAALFPAAKQVTYHNSDLLLLPHRENTTALLRAKGMSVPTPIRARYDWEGGKPFDAQVRTAEMLTMHPRAYVLNGMGTGKTRAALWAWRWLHRQGLAKKLLVVAPLSTLNFTWAREVFTTLPGIKAVVLHGTKDKRLARLADPTADIYIVNHDGLAVIADEFAKRDDIDAVVLDELAVYRNSGAKRTKLAKKAFAGRTWVWGLTGSPTPNEPTDAWAQIWLLTPDRVPKYFGRWRDELMHKVSQFKWVAKEDATDRVWAAMQPAVRFTLDDVVELPELVIRTQQIDLGPKQAKIYKQMEAQAFASLEAGDITAQNSAVVMGKLLQISSGWVYTSDNRAVTLDGNNRLTALVDMIEAIDRKVIVFVPFIHAQQGIFKRLVEEGADAAAVSGETPANERADIFATFQNTNRIKVLVAHPQCMAHGLTLTAANTIIWYSPTTSLEIFEQANARIRRVGQKFKQQIILYAATRAENKMYARLRSKQVSQNMLLDLFADTTASDNPTE